jgi:osmotically-inducible protein OsmY
MISRRRFIHMSATALLPAIVVAGTVNVPIQVSAQVQSSAPSDRAIGQNISKALIKAGIDPRTTSVQVITTSTHVVYLSGLISDPQTIKLAGVVAARTAPAYRIVNNIRSSFFDDPSHVNGGISK